MFFAWFVAVPITFNSDSISACSFAFFVLLIISFPEIVEIVIAAIIIRTIIEITKAIKVTPWFLFLLLFLSTPYFFIRFPPKIYNVFFLYNINFFKKVSQCHYLPIL